MSWIDTSNWTQLHPNAKKLWLISLLTSSLITTTVATGIVFALTPRLPKLLIPAFLIPLGLGAIWLIWGLLILSPRYSRFRYLLGEDDLQVSRGVTWRTWTVIARSRIQHVDIQAGPIAKNLGIVSVKIFVGGQMAEVAEFPGVTPAVAEELRQALVLRKAPSDSAPPIVNPNPAS
ncbi:MAG: PH domain-containing protein [Fimbriimonadaceae bacterium]|jgi:hypothetical protein|nr:PH domain-containing protein [Fimbriimonadaceae bacterium]